MWRNDRRSAGQDASGCSQGSSTRSIAGSRRRRRGKTATAGSGAIGRSESLAEIGRDRAVVAELLVEMARLGPVVAGGHLGKCRVQPTPEAFRLLHQEPADPASALA